MGPEQLDRAEVVTMTAESAEHFANSAVDFGREKVRTPVFLVHVLHPLFSPISPDTH